ncbi:MAG TPA: ABC transporter permease, partial [Leptospiraceae bacterium]|nr:ABC transporter permease [Leptospiraceae bacterium]
MLRRIYAMAWKESLHIIRDFRTLYIAFVIPIFLILLFGYAVNFDIDHIPVGICDQDRSMQSREFISKIQAGGWFEAKTVTSEPQEIQDALQKGRIRIGLFIPAEFHKKLNRGETAQIGAVLDGSDNGSANAGYNYLQFFFNEYKFSILRKSFQQYGIHPPAVPEIKPRILFNPELKSRYYMLPGIIVLITAIMSAMLTSLTAAKEWERGTMEQLISTPVRPHEIILGKILPYTAISMIQSLISASVAVWIFELPFEGRIADLLITNLFFSIGALGIGITVSSVLKSQLPAIQVSLIASMLPSLFFSNFVFPIDSMPLPL